MGDPYIPPYTCPLIDGVIDNINVALKTCSKFNTTDDINEVSYLFESIEQTLDGLEKELEKIRTANSQLRDAAEHWMAYAKDELEVERDTLIEENEGLKFRLEGLEK